ncbi:MAG TPA: thiamine phosphate synthase, partial [Spirochaetota bacterium]|nr:thiamine phosphate synthase [Spirochaetota bacterium]
GGAKIIQYREKDKTGLEKYRECLSIRDAAVAHNAVFIVNDDVDIAIAVGADGVHIGQDDMPIEAVRDIAGDRMIIGLSTHSPSQALDAVRRGADYIGAGPLFRTFTKKNVCDPVGLGYLEFAVRSVSIPVVAIGGIKEDNLGAVLARGAKTVCMVTAITSAPDIPRTVSSLILAIESGGFNVSDASDELSAV